MHKTLAKAGSGPIGPDTASPNRRRFLSAHTGQFPSLFHRPVIRTPFCRFRCSPLILTLLSIYDIYVNINFWKTPISSKFPTNRIKFQRISAICGLNQQDDGDARHGEHESRYLAQSKRFTKNQPCEQHNPCICAFIKNGRHRGGN